jgi:hypothetical protein
MADVPDNRRQIFDAFKDIIVGGELRDFDDLLWEWTSIIERTVRVWHPAGIPWWNTERASLSLFAGAIWKAGGIAFEEFSAERVSSPNNARRGRIDLYFSYWGKDFVAEAKQCWPNVGHRTQQPAQEVVATSLQQAICEVQTVAAEYNQKLAIVFATPWFPIAEMQEIGQCLKYWQREAEAVVCDCKAVYWLRECSWAEVNGYVYPGGAVFIKLVTA